MSLRSNSFNLVPQYDVTRAPGSACPLASETGPVDEVTAPERAVFLRLRDRMRLFVTATRDFDTAEIAEAKRLGQIYVDKSNKQSPDDFSTDLGALAKMSECSECQRRDHCPGAYRAAPADVFSMDEARTRELLSELEGDVLDIGAGDAPYVAALAEAARVGRVRYLALDPDEERLLLLRSRCPWVEICRGTVADLPSARRFQHAVLLRSLNHIPDSELALSQAVERLELGGTLLIVDDVAFGLVRDAEQLKRAEAGSAAFEHYRNDSADEVHARAAQLPLRLLERRDIRPGGSNQWLLHFAKTDVKR